MSRRFYWTLLSLILVAGGCATNESRSPSGSVTLADAAKELGVTIRPTGHPQDRLLMHPDGGAFYVMAGKPYYRFRGDSRPVSGGSITVAGNDLLLPRETVDAMARDLAPIAAAAGPTPRPVPTLEPPSDARPLTRRRDLNGVSIVVDPGHGGKDPGAVAGATLEKTVALAVSRRVMRLLEERGARVLPTRTSDTYPSLDERVALANSKRADLFVSIHANAATSQRVRGVEVLYQGSGARGRLSRGLAEAVVAAVVTETRAHNRRAKEDVRNLRVLRATSMPAVLVEVGFLTHAEERRLLVDPAYQDRLARGIVSGIEHWVVRM